MRYRRGRWDEALEAADAYLEDVDGTHYHAWHALQTRGLIRLSRGDESGIDDSVASIEAARAFVDRSVLSSALAPYSRSLLLVGRFDEARDALDECTRYLRLTAGPLRIRPRVPRRDALSSSARIGDRILGPEETSGLGRGGEIVLRPRLHRRRRPVRDDRLAHATRPRLGCVRHDTSARADARTRRPSSSSGRSLLSQRRGDAVRPRRAKRCSPRRARDSRVAPARARSPRRAT